MGIQTIPSASTGNQPGYVLSVPANNSGSSASAVVNIPAGGYLVTASAEAVSFTINGVTTLATAPSVVLNAAAASVTVNYTPKYIVRTGTSKATSTVRQARYLNGKMWLPNAGATTGLSSSTDGITYSTVTVNNASGMSAIDFNNGETHKWVIGGAGGEIYTSTDSITWTARTSGTTSTIQWIFNNGSSYFVCGATGLVRNSTDGITWNTTTTGMGSETVLFGTFITGITNPYIICSSGGVLQSSTDGVTWTTQSIGFATSSINMVNKSGALVCAVGAGGAYATSTDGVTWSNSNSLFTTSAINVLLSDGTNLVAGTTGGGIHASTNGVTWTTNIANSLASTSSLVDGDYASGFTNKWQFVHSTWDFSSQSSIGQSANEAGVLLSGPFNQTYTLA
jgi:hypothetical protein